LIGPKCVLLMALIIISHLSFFTPAAKAQILPLRTVWEDPRTLTSYHPGGKVNSTFYTFPKVIWDGSKYVDYIFDSSDMSGGVGSVYIKVNPDDTIFYDPNRQEQRIGSESWIVEYYNALNFRWDIDYPKYNRVNSLVNSSGVYFSRTATLNSGSKFVISYWLRVGSRMKISIELCPATSGRFRFVWLLDDVSGTRATWLTRTENVTTQLINDRSCLSIEFADANESKCRLDWSDARLFNKTSLEWVTCFQQLEMKRDVINGRNEARVLFGDFSLLSGESMILDPTIVTFNSFEGDGHLIKYGRTHPPNEGPDVNRIWEEFSTGQLLLDIYYFTYRGYLSFDTQAIPGLAYNISATLRLMTAQDYSTEDFTLQVMGGDQPIFDGPTYFLTPECWDKGTTLAATWNTVDYPGDDIYIDLPIPSSQICYWERTQFELKSNREQFPPSSGVLEYVNFYSGNCVGREPKLEVTYYVDTVDIGGNTWFYSDAGGSKVVIPFFGTGYYYDRIFTPSIETGESPVKLSFLYALLENGFSILGPKTVPDYYADSTWLRDALLWLTEVQGYVNVFLFGFSGGGVVVANEIQKDYATVFSAAVISCAPVDWNDFSNYSIFQSAHTASKAKTATCMPEPVGDDFYDDMNLYYNGLTVDREFHLWDDGHNLFDYNCLQCPEHENVSTLVINWFNKEHPPSTPFTPSGPSGPYANTTYRFTTGTVDPNGDDVKYWFDWGDGTSTTTSYVPSGTNVTALCSWSSTGTYDVIVRAQDATTYSTWSQAKTVTILYGAGDVNRDNEVDIFDAILLSVAFNSVPGGPKWNSAADLNGDNAVDIFDAIILADNFGNKYDGGSGLGAAGQPTSSGAMTGSEVSVVVDSSQITVFKNEIFTVDVKVASVTDLLGWEFKLFWNSTVLNCTNAAVQTSVEWQGNAQNYGSGLENGYNATHARFWAAQSANYPAPSFNGSMTIATLTFQALQPGTTSLALMETKLGNSTGDPIDHTESSGQVSVYFGRYMSSDTQQVNGLSAYKLNIPQSTSSVVNTRSGSGADALFGIRAWVRHSNGVEQEISLDGQTGTPAATVWGGPAGIRSNTVSVTPTALQSTDSLVVRVYVQIGEGPWNLCATFTTEQLHASTLKATVWTVYYYTYSSYNRLYDRTTAKFYWGTTTYNSRIQNLQYC